MFLFIFLLDDKLTDGPALFDLMVHQLFVLGPGCFCDHKNRNSSYGNQSVTGSEVNTISAEQAEAFFSNHKKHQVLGVSVDFKVTFSWISNFLLQSWHRFY